MQRQDRRARVVVDGAARLRRRAVSAAVAHGRHSSTSRPSARQGRAALQRRRRSSSRDGSRKPTSRPSWRLSDPETRAVAYSVLGAIRVPAEAARRKRRLLQKAIRLEPRLLGAHLTLAQVYTLQGKPDLALRLFRRVLELDRVERDRETGPGARRRRRRETTSVAGAGAAGPCRLQAVARRAARAGHGLSEDGESRCGRRSGRGLDAACRRAAGLVDQVRAAPRRGRRVPGSASTSSSAPGRPGPPSYELAFTLGGAYLLNGDPARALDAYDAALTLKPDSLPALRQAARARRTAGRARAIALVLDAREEARRRTIRRSCWDSAASASRWIFWRTPSPR